MESDAKLLGAERIAGRGIYYPPCPCIRAVMRIEGRFPLISASYLEPLKEYAEREKLTVAGDPVSKQERRRHKIPRHVAARRGGLTLHQV